MPAQNNMEMQYQSPVATMRQEQPSNDSPAEQQNTKEDPPKRTFLGMRGGGIILDLCACFICCECMEGCCNAIDDCCCC
ncbi:hypothetical protein AC579_9273 [Pseudocercospora musae]|uniref:Uncharacterized protein n=1 Tax=Pseudocercospora musae TaxID=113226 RepID=A0A139IHN2_9PEZI|nr:hypothetical protein AC579_9273 [Pseudocercospora musae]